MLLDHLITRLSRDRVTILLLHKVPKALDPAAPNEHDLPAFEALLDRVTKLFHVVPLHEVLHPNNRNRLPQNAACITFDDGYPDWISGVGPTMLKRGLHGTFFITTGQLQGTPLWHERIRHCFREAKTTLQGSDNKRYQVLCSRFPAMERDTVDGLERELKYLALDKRDNILAELEQLCNAPPLKQEHFTQDHVRQLANWGFDIGGHTVNHPILTETTPHEAWHEIAACRETLMGITGGPVRYFAYPNGRQIDFNDDHVHMVKRAGYKGALTTAAGTLGHNTSIFRIPRFTPWGPGAYKTATQFLRNLIVR